MKKLEKTGFGDYLFFNWRYLDAEGKQKNPEFILNRPPYQEAQILVADENFGCGSSREQAPWALRDFGVRCIIAPSFGSIFYQNCFKVGILPIDLQAEEVELIFQGIETAPPLELTVDLQKQTVQSLKQQIFVFEIPEFEKHCLLAGVDEIELSLKMENSIQAFEQQHIQQFPWLSDLV